MFNSIHSSRLFRYFVSKKKFLVTVRLTTNDRYHTIKKEVVAYTSGQAKQIAIKEVKYDTHISIDSCNSLGKIKAFHEFKKL